MRNLEIKPKAKEAITDISDFLELINTTGSGERWANKLEIFLQRLASSSVKKFPLCHNLKLAGMGFSCRVYKRKWIIAFKYTDKKFIVYRFVLGSKLK